MEMEIHSEGTRAIIDPQGAWLAFLSDELGEIIYPRRVFTLDDGHQKLRGGSHVCLPNFGPGGESGLPQHGFGRQAAWQTLEWDDSHVVLSLEKGIGTYHDMSSLLTYAIEKHTLVMTLAVENHGKAPLRVAPGFHPYFQVPRATPIYFDDDQIDLGSYVETRYAGGQSHELVLPHRVITLDSSDMTMWAQWTDGLGDYVCIEPTLDGYAFLREPTDETLLHPGEQRLFTLAISWHNK